MTNDPDYMLCLHATHDTHPMRRLMCVECYQDVELPYDCGPRSMCKQPICFKCYGEKITYEQESSGTNRAIVIALAIAMIACLFLIVRLTVSL